MVMIRSYNCLGDTCTQNTSNATCLITNKRGSYWGQTFPNNISQHEGFFVVDFLNENKTDWIPYKIIDEISFEEPAKQVTFDNGIIRVKSKTNWRIFLMYNLLLYC